MRRCGFWPSPAFSRAAVLLTVLHHSRQLQIPLRLFVQRNMQPGSAAFLIPSPIKRDEPVEAVLEIRPPTITPGALQQELGSLAGRMGIGAAGAIRVAPRMVATLVTDRACAIVPKDAADQAINLREGARWRWTVTPKVRGTIKATVTLAAPVIINGRESSYTVTSFERTVTVTVTSQGLAGDTLTWVKDYWVIVAAVGTAIGGLWAWLRRRQSRRRAGF